MLCPVRTAGTCSSDVSEVFQGAGTDDDTLIRGMVTRSEVDMLDIRAQFRKMFARSLYSMIKVRKHIFKVPLLFC